MVRGANRGSKSQSVQFEEFQVIFHNSIAYYANINQKF